MIMIQRLGTLIPLLAMLTLVGNVQGQSGLYADPGDPDGPSRGLAIPNDASTGALGAGLSPTPADLSGGAESIGLGDILEPPAFGDTNGYCLEDVAPLESTGSWLQRGYWFVEEDVVLLNRQWDKSKKDLVLATAAEFGPNSNLRRLGIRPTQPGVFANIRMTVGRFMFRDDDNRDHFTEFTYFGGGQSELKGSAIGTAPNQLNTPFAIDRGFFSFDGSNAQAFRYTHEFGGLEYNYHVKRRMRRDQMVLLPEGRWVRRASPTQTREFFGGIRWLAIDEKFKWTATGDPISANRNGSMRIKAENDLLGFQVGAGQAYEFSRFSISLRGKAGVYANFTDINRSFRVRNFAPAVGTTPAANTLISADDGVFEAETLAFIGETSLIGRYHIHQNFSLRFSSELMYVDSIAIVPNQIFFVPGRRRGILSGNSLYLGFGFGIEGYW